MKLSIITCQSGFIYIIIIIIFFQIKFRKILSGKFNTTLDRDQSWYYHHLLLLS